MRRINWKNEQPFSTENSENNFAATVQQNSVFKSMNGNQKVVDEALNNKKWPIQHELPLRNWQRSNSFQAEYSERLESSCPEESYFKNSFFMRNSPSSPLPKGHQSSLKNMLEAESMFHDSSIQKQYSSSNEQYWDKPFCSNFDSTNYGKKCPACQEINEKDSNWCMECGKAIISVEIRRYNQFGEPSFVTKPLNPHSSSWNGSYSPPYNAPMHETCKEPVSNNLNMMIKDLSLSNQFALNQSPSAIDAKSSVSFDFENPQFEDIHHENYHYSKHHAVYRRASNGGQNCKDNKEDFYPFDDLLYPDFAIYDPNLGHAFPSSNIVSNGFYLQQAYCPVSEEPTQDIKILSSIDPKKRRNSQKKKKKTKKSKV